MSTFYSHHRSSDSVDFERTTAIKELRELATTEETTPNEKSELPCSEEPRDHTSTAPTEERFATTRDSATQRSRSSSRAAHLSTFGARIEVFRDGDDAPLIRNGVNAVASSKPAQDVENRSSSLHKSMHDLDLSASNMREDYDHDKTVTISSSRSPTVFDQLQDISARRADLLQQLNKLQAEEHRLLMAMGVENQKDGGNSQIESYIVPSNASEQAITTTSRTPLAQLPASLHTRVHPRTKPQPPQIGSYDERPIKSSRIPWGGSPKTSAMSRDMHIATANQTIAPALTEGIEGDLTCGIGLITSSRKDHRSRIPSAHAARQQRGTGAYTALAAGPRKAKSSAMETRPLVQQGKKKVGT